MMHMCNFKGLTRAPSSFDGHLLICPCARLLSRNKFVILTPARWSSCMCPLFAPRLSKWAKDSADAEAAVVD